MDQVVGKANKTLGMLMRTFEISEPRLSKDQYRSLVSPYFEYAVQAYIAE